MKLRLPAVVEILRPEQFVKNILVFAGLFFAIPDSRQNVVGGGLSGAALRTLAAFAVFCAISGATYIMNDVRDAEKDRIHPEKCKRPVASGRLSKTKALFEMLLILLFCAVASPFIDKKFTVCIWAYFLMQAFYTLWFKNIILLDVFVVSLGFVMRVYGGTAAAGVPTSQWILICTFMGALFLAFCKRRGEKITLGNSAGAHREVLRFYDLTLLDHLVTISAASTVICYSIYTLEPETINKFGTDGLFFTIPFVFFGICRYLFLVMCGGQGGNPEKIFTRDIAIIVDVVLYIAVCLLAFAFGGITRV